VNGEPTAEAGPGSVICQNTSYTLSGSAAYYSVSVWHTEGDGSFDDPFLLNATYTPGPEDIQNGNVYLTLYCVAIPPCTGVANDMLELIIKRVPDKPITPIGPTSIILGPNLSSDYYTHPVAYAYTYYWYLSPLEAGTINGMDTSAIVFWNEDFTGTNALISVEAENDCATVSSDTLTVDIITVGIAESPLPVVSISPNPSSGIISISIEGIAREMNLSVLSSRGDIVHTRQINYNNPSYSFQLNLSQQASGIYYLILVWDEHKITEQFILRSK
jgi:hypothetical protein